MNLQTLNCLACHILAKHPQSIKNNKEHLLIAIKTKPTATKVNPSTIQANKEYNYTAKSTNKHSLRKIASTP